MCISFGGRVYSDFGRCGFLVQDSCSCIRGLWVVSSGSDSARETSVSLLSLMDSVCVCVSWNWLIGGVTVIAWGVVGSGVVRL